VFDSSTCIHSSLEQQSKRQRIDSVAEDRNKYDDPGAEEEDLFASIC
jgi:hypothetical protein